MRIHHLRVRPDAFVGWFIARPQGTSDQFKCSQSQGRYKRGKSNDEQEPLQCVTRRFPFLSPAEVEGNPEHEEVGAIVGSEITAGKS